MVQFDWLIALGLVGCEWSIEQFDWLIALGRSTVSLLEKWAPRVILKLREIEEDLTYFQAQQQEQNEIMTIIMEPILLQNLT